MQLPVTDLARCPLIFTDGSVEIRLQVPQWLLPQGLVCGFVRSSTNCLASTNFLRRDVPVFLTNLKIGCGGAAEDKIRDPMMLALADELEVPVKLLVLLRVGSTLH